MPAPAPKRRRLGISTVPAARLRAERPNYVWALDFIFDATSDGRPLKTLSMCDEFTRENLVRRIGRSITAADVVDALDEAYTQRGAPEFIRCANGPELVAAAIRDWCRFTGTGTACIEPGSPGRTPTRRASTAGSATSSSPARSSTASWRREFSSTTGAMSTTATAPPARSATWRPPSSPRRGRRERRAQTSYHQPPRPPPVDASTPRNPHRGWTSERGPISGERHPSVSTGTVDLKCPCRVGEHVSPAPVQIGGGYRSSNSYALEAKSSTTGPRNSR